MKKLCEEASITIPASNKVILDQYAQVVTKLSSFLEDSHPKTSVRTQPPKTNAKKKVNKPTQASKTKEAPPNAESSKIALDIDDSSGNVSFGFTAS